MQLRRPRVLIATGSVLLCAGLMAGLVNHEVLDGSRFAEHVDNIRQDPDVARQVGEAMSARVLEVNPNLVAVEPLIEATAVNLAGSPAFSPIVRTAAARVHDAFTSSDHVVLRVADVGAVLTGVLRATAPDAAAQLPPDLDVTLTEIGRQSFASDTIHLTHLVSLLSWLLPLLALVCFACAIWFAADRQRAATDVGWGVIAVGAVLVAGSVVLAIATSFADTDTLEGALIAAAWTEFRIPLFLTAGATVAAGWLITAAASRGADLGTLNALSEAWSWLTVPAETARGRLARALVWLALGCGLLFRPSVVLVVLAIILGSAFVIHAASELVLLAKDRMGDARHSWPRRIAAWRLSRFLPVLVGGAVLVALLIVLARPVDQEVALDAQAAGGSSTCNGHVELCDRTYDQVAFAGTHNSMSAVDVPNWFFPEQPKGIVGQLDDGIRVLLIDTWYGQTTKRPGVVATSAKSQAAALAEARETYGPSVVESALRIRDAANLTPTGPVRPYLCHGMCELGSMEWEPVMEDVRGWLEAHPREVVTFFIQDEVSPADTAKVFDEAGLLPYVHTQSTGSPWPTLEQMIDSGRRVVVLMEQRGGGSEYPWLLQGFDWVQDTPFDFVSKSDFTCERLRGTATSPLFLVNHWLNNNQTRVTDAIEVNAYDVLWPRVSQCQRERGMIPNYVAVDFYDRGDLLEVVDKLNGVD